MASRGGGGGGGAGGLEELLGRFRGTLELDETRGRVRCTLSGHELPARAEAVQAYVGGACGGGRGLLRRCV